MNHEWHHDRVVSSDVNEKHVTEDAIFMDDNVIEVEIGNTLESTFMIDEELFEAATQEVSTWFEKKKYCSIIFDELPLEDKTLFNQKYANDNEINDFVHLRPAIPDLADCALVFVVKGALQKWQQVIAYHFYQGDIPEVELKDILKSVVEAVGRTGLIPVAIIVDEGSSFQSALESLQEDIVELQGVCDINTDGIIRIGQYSLSIIYNPPKLLMDIYNNFLTKDISFNGKRAKWSNMVKCYKTGKEAGMPVISKIKDEHILPEKITKVEVKQCIRVLSTSMARILGFSSTLAGAGSNEELKDSLLSTYEVVLFIDKLFDSVNGVTIYNKKRNKDKNLRSAVTPKSPHVKFWTEAILKLEQFTFLEGDREFFSPCIECWQITLKSFLRLQRFFSTKNIKIMYPGYLNSELTDPVERDDEYESDQEEY